MRLLDVKLLSLLAGELELRLELAGLGLEPLLELELLAGLLEGLGLVELEPLELREMLPPLLWLLLLLLLRLLLLRLLLLELRDDEEE